MPIKVRNVRESFQIDTQRTIKVLAAGPPGAGKTRSASTWPNVLYADVEGRLLSVRDRDVHSVGIESIADLDELRAALSQDPSVRQKLLGVPVETVVIDTVDEVARLVVKERLRSEKQETMRMNDWGYLGDTLRSMLRGFRNLDLNVLFNVHIKPSEDSETGRIEYKPDIQGAVGNEIAAYVDEAFLLVARPTVDVKTGERIIVRHFQTYPDSQHTWVKDHSGTLPLEFPINFEDDYARLAKFIFGEVTAPSGAATLSTSAPTPVAKPVKSVGKAVKTRAYPVKEGGIVDVSLPEVAPAPVPEPEAKPASEPAPEPPADSVPGRGTEPDLLADLDGGDKAATKSKKTPLCADCEQPIDNPDQAEISLARWGVPLCRADFAARKNRKRT